MKKKIFIITLFLILAVIGVGFYFRKDISKIKEKVYPIVSLKEKENKEETNKEINQKEDSTGQEIAQQEEVKKDATTTKKESTKENSNSTKSNTKTETTKKSETKTQTKQEKVDTNSQESGVVDPNGNAVKEEKVIVVKKEPWESAGVSEYEWYHNPVYSWMRVDYPVSSCGSVSSCESLCMKDAEELSYTENVSCIQVHTYSGSYLGEMLKRD